MVKYWFANNAEFGLAEREAQLQRLLSDADVPFAAGDVPHVLLSTCNRIELYWGEGSVPEAAVRHLYRVAAGLESSLTGERAIQGQLKQSYIAAIERYSLSPHLNRLFQTAIHTGKRVRTETRIAEGAVSHSQITADILRHENIDLKRKFVSIIGANKLTEDILKYLTARGATNIFLSNRHIEKAAELADRYGGTAMSLDNKRSMLDFTDVLICATSAPHLIVHEDDIKPDKEMIIFDLAFPRDVDERLNRRATVRLYNLEDIEKYAQKNVSLRQNEICKAEEIIEEEIGKFYQWQKYADRIKTQIEEGL